GDGGRGFGWRRCSDDEGCGGEEATKVGQSMVAERWWWCVAVDATTVDGGDGGDEEQRWCSSVGGDVVVRLTVLIRVA
ncbi:hypothetical protein Tco_0961208, partial [Tanacetum coccineum]